MNIVLIGMPGCGKSTVGEMLAKQTGKSFVDCDKYIEDKSGMTVPEIFERLGEGEFRKREIAASVELGKQDNLVISTGGGCVEFEANITALGENGVIVFIDRNLKNIFSDIDISGRPLLADKKERLNNIFERREPLYNRYCHIRIENNGSIEETVKKIIKETEEYEDNGIKRT